MGDILNDNCWLNILKCLNLENQLSVALVSQRLAQNVHKHWKSCKEANITRNVHISFKRHPELMVRFLEGSSRVLEKLEVSYFTMELLMQMKSQVPSFPTLRMLDCHFQCDEKEDDEMIEIMTRLFPNITTLCLGSFTSGNHLWKWADLEVVELNGFGEISTDYANRLFNIPKLRVLHISCYDEDLSIDCEHLKCENLEEIDIDNESFWLDYMPYLLTLPRLRKLTYLAPYQDENILNMIADLRGSHVEMVRFNASGLTEEFCDALEKMLNLRSLIIRKGEVRAADILRICKKLHSLEELHLVKIVKLPTTRQFWKMVGMCKNLKVLNISNSKFHDDFESLSPSIIRRVFKDRPEPLLLHCYNSGLRIRRLTKALKHPKIKVSLAKLQIEYWSRQYIQVDMQPIVKKTPITTV